MLVPMCFYVNSYDLQGNNCIYYEVNSIVLPMMMPMPGTVRLYGKKGLTGKPASPCLSVVGATGFEPVTSTV
jgi:hypothetical protein